jgi:alpha-aminoadipic semialdehyde synthase
MEKIIGIRREDKNKWERRAPLIPEHVKELKEKFGIKTIVQPSKIRIFTDQEYQAAGAEVNEDLSPAKVILAIKEIPEKCFINGRTYIFFSHTIKGQAYNMDMLRRLMDLKCNLIDYERIVNEKNQRLIFFGKYAGRVGLIETLNAFGQKIKVQGLKTPFEDVKQAYKYSSLAEAKKQMDQIGDRISKNGIPNIITPLVVGFAGYGNVSQGAQEIFDLLPHEIIPAGKLLKTVEKMAKNNKTIYKVVFKEEDMMRPKQGNFILEDYFEFPKKYVSQFEQYIPHLGILVNCIYWTKDYPRLVTKQYLKKAALSKEGIKLKVIGDISCDIDGSIEITHKVTKPDRATYTYFPRKDQFEDGTHQDGLTVMAIDNLPCEFPRESSTDFSEMVKGFVNDIVLADGQRSFQNLKVAEPVKRAWVLLKGQFTPEYQYMKGFLK